MDPALIGHFSWEPGSSQVCFLCLARQVWFFFFFFCCQRPFPLVPCYCSLLHHYVWKSSHARAEYSWEYCVYTSRVITAVCKCYEFRTSSRLNVISPFHFHVSSVTASTTCEKLEKARNELQIAYEGFVQKLNQQHQTDLTELENRLKEFYTGECEKLQNIYIEEAEKYQSQLQEQVCAFGSRAWSWSWPLIWNLTAVGGELPSMNSSSLNIHWWTSFCFLVK